MKFCLQIFAGFIFLLATSSCRSTKKLQTAINKKDTAVTIIHTVPDFDSLSIASLDLKSLEKNKIDFKTFSAKVKVEYQDRNGKQPDVNAFIRLYKDSILWVSVSATFLNIEAFRILIKPDTIIILNKIDKTIEHHPFSYIESVAHIPLTFSILQDVLVGNPIYVGDSIVAYRQTENHVLIATVGKFFKNLLTISTDNKLLQKSKLDDISLGKNRTADLVYDNYEKNNEVSFATYREITVAEKTKVDIRLTYKQYEFNKELSFPFNIPRNYKTK
jgi:predicted metal-dependent HD superfamily phosphohydrolase